MYSHFIQFTIPKIGQALVAVILYLNFLDLPFVQVFAGDRRLLYYGLPLLLLWGISFLSRNPLGFGMVFVGHLTVLYLLCDGATLLARLAGGPVLSVWQTVYAGGLLPWAVTALWMLWGRRRAVALQLTRYRLTTAKALPGGSLRVLQISDLHPGPTMNHTRIPELREKIALAAPDLIVLTGDIFDEYTSRTDFDAFCQFFGQLTPPLGKYFVYGNHDLGHYWTTASFTRADLEAAFHAAGIQILEDQSQPILSGVPLRVVGRRDWLFCQGRRLSPADLLPGGPDEVYTLWLDHEPRELAAAAAAGADLILSGHTHGGQIWPTGLLARLFRYNELNYGLRQVTPACAAVVSGGTGTWGYRVRTEGRTELVLVEIESTASCCSGNKDF